MGIATRGLTYEDYMCDPEEMRRYDILDGEKIYMPNPTIRHQDLLWNLGALLRTWQQAGHPGKVVVAPCDVLIRRSPLRTRQPDILFISAVRLGDRRLDDPAPLEPSPELVVEILLPSETRRVQSGKLADYCGVDVQECWVVSPGEQTVEILRLSPDGAKSMGVFSGGQTAQSSIFPDLCVDITAVFAP